MLVISRRKGQRIAIGDDIEIVITEVHRSNVHVGLRAPRGYTVLRGEVSDAISAANREAASITLERAGELAGIAPHAGGARGTTPSGSAASRQAPDAASSQSRDARDGAEPGKAPAGALATPKPGGP